jgi:hypothetical protein
MAEPPFSASLAAAASFAIFAPLYLDASEFGGAASTSGEGEGKPLAPYAVTEAVHSVAATAAATSAAAVIREKGAVAAAFEHASGAPQNGHTHSFDFTWREQASHGCNFVLMAFPQVGDPSKTRARRGRTEHTSNLAGTHRECQPAPARSAANPAAVVSAVAVRRRGSR